MHLFKNDIRPRRFLKLHENDESSLMASRSIHSLEPLQVLRELLQLQVTESDGPVGPSLSSTG